GAAAPRCMLRPVWLAAGVVAVAVIAGAAGLIARSRSRAVLDPNLVAVAPFDVLDAKLELWREGLVDVLSRNLDGAGPLRTVSPTVVIRRWSGRADPASAAELGHRTGAPLAVFGSLVGVGSDSVRLAATPRALARDSTFALALRHAGLALGWQRSGFDSLSRAYGLRAGRYVHGLAPRDSLLVTADSLSGAVWGLGNDPAFHSHLRRWVATLEEA